MNNLLFYTTDDGKSQIQLRADLGTVWLTQLEMAELFDATKQNISLHLKNIIEDGELDANSVVKESLTADADGKNNPVSQYNFRATWPFPNFYTLCRELLAPAKVGNCQGMLDSSNIKSLTAMWRAGDQFATRRVANFTFAAFEVTTKESSVVREGWGESL